jgi:hypothetical protein
MGQLNKLIIVICFIFFYRANAQDEKKFYITKDTIILEDVNIISLNNQDGMFLVKGVDIKKGIDLKKLLKDGKVYLFSDDIYRYFSLKDFEKAPKYNNCVIQERFSYNKNITVRKLNPSVKKFIIGLVRVDYYNEKTITVDKGRTFFDEKNKYYFYKIAFPICE